MATTTFAEKFKSALGDFASKLQSSQQPPSPEKKLQDWWEEAQSETEFTPDALLLGQWEYQPILVCDEMMKSLPAHKLLGDKAIYIGKVFTDQNSFVLWKKKLGKESFAIPLRDLNNPKRARIRGELYFVPTNLIYVLDNYKQNNVQFKRRKVEVNLPYRYWHLVEDETGAKTVKVCCEENLELRVWMYIGSEGEWGHQLDGGYLFGTAERFFPKHAYSEPYYALTINDFKSRNNSEEKVIEPREQTST